MNTDSIYYFILYINQNILIIPYFFAFDSKFYNKLGVLQLDNIFGIF